MDEVHEAAAITADKEDGGDGAYEEYADHHVDGLASSHCRPVGSNHQK